MSLLLQRTKFALAPSSRLTTAHRQLKRSTKGGIGACAERPIVADG